MKMIGSKLALIVLIKIMDIKTAEFIKGIIGTDKILEDNKSQIAFVGRSNVGKSSIINLLANRKNLVKSSSKPGKTRQINFFLINKKVYFVDLPGYGFMKIKLKKKEKIRKLIIWYLFRSEVKIDKVVLIIDAKTGPTDFDMEMLDLLKNTEREIIIVANKIDKLKKNDIKKQINKIEEVIGYQEIIPFSAKKKIGKEKLLEKIFNNYV